MGCQHLLLLLLTRAVAPAAPCNPCMATVDSPSNLLKLLFTLCTHHCAFRPAGLDAAQGQQISTGRLAAARCCDKIDFHLNPALMYQNFGIWLLRNKPRTADLFEKMQTGCFWDDRAFLPPCASPLYLLDQAQLASQPQQHAAARQTTAQQ